jgi:hypothetical protein
MTSYATVTYDRAQDYVLIRYRAVVLATDSEVAAFAAEIDAPMRELGRKVDILVDLGDLAVKPAAARAYDEVRQRMIRDYANRAYRYSGSTLVRTKILTSSTLHGQQANVFESHAEALEALRADRATETRRRR